MYPILEFDSDLEAIITPYHLHKKLAGAECCVMCFFQKVVEKTARDRQRHSARENVFWLAMEACAGL